MAKSKAPSPWKRPSPAMQGDVDKSAIWLAVGRALSAWGEYESELGRLFTVFLAGDFPSPQAMKAFGAIRTFEGRQEMIIGASTAFFGYRFGTKEEKEKYDIIRANFIAVQLRNDIAHGIVMPFGPPRIPVSNGFCLIHLITTKNEI